MSSHLDRKCMLTTSELTQYFRYSKVVLTVFNQFDKLSGRDEISRNAFFNQGIISSNCAILCQDFMIYILPVAYWPGGQGGNCPHCE